MRIDLESHEVERVERRRLDNRHVVGRTDRGADEVRPCTRAGVGHSFQYPRTYLPEQSALVKRLQQTKRISSTNKDRLRPVDRRQRIRQLVNRFEFVADLAESVACF